MLIEEALSELAKCNAAKLAEIDAIVGCAQEAARLLKLLANEKRLIILCFLATCGEMTVGALAKALNLSQSALSQHLAKLRRDGLVQNHIVFERLVEKRGKRLAADCFVHDRLVDDRTFGHLLGKHLG